MPGLVQHVFSNTIPSATGTITVWNVSGVSTTVAATNVIRPQDWNSTHNMSVTITGNTIGNTSVVYGTNISLSGGPGIALSGDSLNSQVGIYMANSNQLGTFFPPGGGAIGVNAYATIPLPVSSLYLQPWVPPVNASVISFVLPISMITSNNFTTGASSGSGAWTFTLALYSQNVSTLSSMTSFTNLLKYSATSTAITVTISQGASSTTFNLTANQTVWGGLKFWRIPMATSVSAGGTYFIGVGVSTAGNTGTAASAGLQPLMLGGTGANNSWGVMASSGILTSAGSVTDPFSPVFYSAGTFALPATIPIGGGGSALIAANTWAFFNIVAST